MLTFIIPFLVGTIVGFLIRGKPSDTFAITTGKRVAWAIGFGFGGLLIGMPIGLAISPTTGPQMAGMIGFGLGFGLFNVLSIENAAYRKWSEGHALAWLVGGLSVAIVAWYFLTKNASEILDRVSGVPDGTTSIHMSPEAPARSTDSVAAMKQRAEQGDAVAQGHLGLKYSLGHEVAKNDAEAVKWFRLAADQGDATAQFFLGVAYDKGEGVAENDAEAMKWYLLAAARGDADAQYKLGVLYVFGSGIPESRVDAYFWWHLAAAQGNVHAKSLKALLAEKMTREQIAEAQRRSADWKPKKE